MRVLILMAALYGFRLVLWPRPHHATTGRKRPSPQSAFAWLARLIQLLVFLYIEISSLISYSNWLLSSWYP